MGVAGVAISTVISNYVSATMIIFFLLNEEEGLRLDLRKLHINKIQLAKTARIGVPAGLQGMVFCFSNICIQGGINSFGSNAMAGSAAALNFEYFSYFVVSAFTQAATTFTSQNYGVGKYKRMDKVLIDCLILSSGMALVMQHTDQTVPVSKQYAPTIKERIKNPG